WQYFLVCTGGSDLEWDHSFATLCNVNQLAWFNLERWAVNTLTVNQDVLVNNQLAGLCDGTGETGTQYESIQAGLQHFYQVFTGQTRTAACFFEVAHHLGFTNVVDCPQTLLFFQTYRVVRVLTTTSTAVLSWTVWAALHVLFSFWSQGNTECTRVAHCAAVTKTFSHNCGFLFLSCGIVWFCYHSQDSAD